MYIKNLALKNFGCFKDLYVENLEKNKIYIIYGENRDEDAKNGLGKSHFLESIPVCFYGETLRPQLKDIKKYVSWTADKKDISSVDITLHDGVRIVREINPKENVIIENCDVDIDTNNRRTNTQQTQLISRIIGTYNNFRYLHYFNPSSLVFFAQPPKEKYLFVEELLEIEKLSELLDEYNDLEKTLLTQLKSVGDVINKTTIDSITFVNKVNSEIERLRNEIDKYKLQISHNNKSKEQNEHFHEISFNTGKTALVSKLSEFSSQLESCLNHIRNKLKDIKSLNVDIKSHKAELDCVIGSVTTQLPIKNADLTNVKARIRNLNNIIGTVEAYLENPSKCPTCKRDYDMDINSYSKENANIDSYDELKRICSDDTISIDKNNDYLNISTKISSIENEIKKIESDIYSFVENFLVIVNSFIAYMNDDINNELYQVLTANISIDYLKCDIKHPIDNIKAALTSSLKLFKLLSRENDVKFLTEILEDGFLDINDTNPIEKELVDIAWNAFVNKYYVIKESTIDESVLLNAVKDSEFKIAQYQGYQNSDEYKNFDIKLCEENSKKIEIEARLEKIKILLNELGWSGEFRKLIIENYLHGLEEKYNEYIAKLLPACRIKFKLEVSGREKGIHIILYDGDIIKSYGELSSAEKRMVDICLLLTFAEYSDGLIVIDEALDSLSYENQMRVINLLHETNRQIFLVSHNKELIKNLQYQHDNVEHINFIKENGVSKLM